MNTPESLNSAGFRIGDLHVLPETGQVDGPSGAIHLEPRVMAVLEALARKPGQLVSRTELLESIWTGGEVYDEALTQCVYQLRQQLLSAGGGEGYRNLITTVPKRGYVLNAEVLPVAGEPGARGMFRRAAPVIAVALALLIALGLVWTLSQRGNPPGVSPTPQQARSIAVLPFLPLVADHGEPVLELGMADTLITQLSGGSGLVVRPMSSVRRYDTLERDSLQAGRELGVDAVVDGSIQRSGESLRVSVRLLRVSDGAALWADTFSAPFSNVFSVQDDICSRIVSALAPELGQEVSGDPVRGRTSSTQAYERYLQGRYHLARLSPADLRLSVDHFRAAVALDPDYAQAWLGLANVQFRIPIAGEAVPREFYPLARQAAERALGIDPSLAEGYAMLGWIDHWFEWDWAASEANFQRAIKMDPNNTESHLGYAHLLSNTGRHEQAVEEVRRARELSPFYTVAAALEGGFLARAGRAEEAVRQMEEARGTGDKVWLLHASLASGYLALGRYEDALAEVQRAREISGESTWAMATETSILTRMGRRAEADAVRAELLQRSTERYVPPYDLAVAHHALGDLDSALAMLERGFELRDPKMALLAVGGWDPISDRPAFQELLKRMNLQSAMK